ncbi:MAG TPA: pyruvate:ferredoxin (flavodoxin) oxidoreductase [Acidimicrobiia bacterium]|nr:pyruvate:ferredoxin (flavodoxin) oxidoreductase [Acidimicrobiia bacterium]
MTENSLHLTLDGNEAAARVAHALSEVIAIYPITPASPMGELADAWSQQGRANAWGVVPEVIEMQSEAGAAGAVHGSLLTGALTTTFTASQGLLLMLPNMYKIAGELTPTVFHVAARTLATHALSIFGDHSDVMAARPTGFALLASSSVQEAQDLALIAHSAALRSRVPFLHFFDGFRTSHEVAKIEGLDLITIRDFISEDLIAAHRHRGLNPERPVLRGSAQNPDVFFQAREAANPFYQAVPGIVEEEMARLAARTGRNYQLFDYYGHPQAQRVIVLMGSGAGSAREAVDSLLAQGEPVGMVTVRLYRPFAPEAFVKALPQTVQTVAVLDRTKEPGAVGDPLYLDVVTALSETGASPIRVIGGRYGLSSKEFTPPMAVAVFRELASSTPRRHFTVGINDDVTHLSLAVEDIWQEPEEVVAAVFFGLGSDGTVSANKSSVKIIGENTDLYAQGYFVYDSKKSGSITVSHLRFGPRPIHSTYLIGSGQATFVACHFFQLLEEIDVLSVAAPGCKVLLNSPHSPEATWDQLPQAVQETIIAKSLEVWVVDAAAVARQAGLGGRINTVLQTCFFELSGVLPSAVASTAIKKEIEKAYGKRGDVIIRRNHAAVDQALSGLRRMETPASATGSRPGPAERLARKLEKAPDFVQRVTALMMAGQGDSLPVSALPVDGTFPTGTARWEKRSIATEIPIWDPSICIDCARCALACPHAAIRIKVFEVAVTDGAPPGFQWKEAASREFAGRALTVQVAPDDCTGCGVCVDVCPAHSKEEVKHRAINMESKEPHLQRERTNFEYFLEIPDPPRSSLKLDSVKGSQLIEPLFEFSGACAGCGETPYIKLLSQMFGDRTVIANATGCSSIYGGNLPTTPYTVDGAGRGPAWANSLFEDNAEFGLGIRLALDRMAEDARLLVTALLPDLGMEAWAVMEADQSDQAGIEAQRERVAALKEKVAALDSPLARRLQAVADALVKKSVWIVGGDGWAYDIGFGGVDHVLASGRNVNLLVLDTEVYSNTGGQASKATPRAAVAKFAAGGKATGKKDLGQLAMAYGNVYVAQIAMGANMTQTVRALAEAEAHQGVSLIIAYSPCIAHGIDMSSQMTHQKRAAESGYWPLYRYDPDLELRGRPGLRLDSRQPTLPFREFAAEEARFAVLTRANPERAGELLSQAQRDIDDRWQLYEQLVEVHRKAEYTQLEDR